MDATGGSVDNRQSTLHLPGVTVKNIVLAALMCGVALTLSACERKGPMERAGEKVDETVRTLKNGGEKTTGDKVKDAADDVRKDAEKAADDVKDAVKK